MSVHLIKVIFFTILTQTSAFNLSPKFSIIFNEPINSFNTYFGYSVHLRAGNSNFKSSVVIGAPKANSTLSYLKYINEPGVVYQCDIEDNPICNPLLIDNTGDSRSILNGIPYIHGKSNSWLGATIDGESTRDGKLVACAPRWINRHHYEKINSHPMAIGMCYLESNTHYLNRTADKIIPFLSLSFSSDELNFVGEAGISLHVPKDEGSIVMGAVGLNYWKGGVVLYNKRNVQYPSITYYANNINYYSYLGYAVSSGKITKTGEIVYFASAPRDNGYRGRVYALFARKSTLSELKIENMFFGTQTGAYFGASICLVDVNGDGLDDVLIGAPRYSIHLVHIESGDEGAVFVYINMDNYRFQQQEKLQSQRKPRAEFGSTIASLGDLDMDGFNDVVVGAPYEDNGKGAIYIYLGSAKGLNSMPSQHIRAETINSNLLGFGISVSKGVDIDNNFYNDLAVGSFKSGNVVLFRSHPVIQLNGRIILDKNEISIDTHQFNTQICMKYSGKVVPLNTTINVIFNVDPIYRRAIIDEFNNATMEKNILLKKDNEFCLKTAVSITATIQDFSNPIELELKYNTPKNENQSIFCSFCPVLSPLAKTTVNVQVPYITGCSNDIKCRPNLKINAIASDKIIVGSKNNVYLNISLTNYGEPAFITRLIINMPNLLGFIQIPQNCMEIEELQINCEFDTFLSNQTKDLNLELNTFKIINNLIPYKINLTVISAGDEEDFNDNNILLPLEVITISELRLFGNSSSEFLRMDQIDDNYTVIQEYIVQNLGPSVVNEALLEIHIPIIYDNITLIRVLKPEDVNDCIASDPGFYTSTVDNEDSLKEMEGNIPSRVIRDTFNVETEDINLMSNNYNSSGKNENYHNANRTLFFNCSNQREEHIICMIIKCRFLLMEDMESKKSIKISLRPQIDNMDRFLADKDSIQVEFLAIAEPFIKPNISRGSTTTLTFTVIHTSPDEKFPIIFIIIATILGIKILGLIIWGLWKYGFFTRNTKKRLNLLQNDFDGSQAAIIDDQ